MEQHGGRRGLAGREQGSTVGCRDRVVNYLSGQGYNIVRLPRAKLAPLDLIGVDGRRTDTIGALADMFQEPRPTPPEVGVGENFSAFEGQRTDKLDASVGLSVLKEILKAFGADLDVKAAYSRARTVQFTFTKVTRDSIAPLKLGDYLTTGIPLLDNPLVDHLLFGDGDVFVISEVLRSAELKVAAESKDKESIEVDLPFIQKAVEGKIEVVTEGEQSSTVHFKGEAPVAFAFKCYEVDVVPGGFSLRQGSTDVALDEDRRQEPEPVLLRPNRLLTLSS